jgi:hypothetical protein
VDDIVQEKCIVLKAQLNGGVKLNFSVNQGFLPVKTVVSQFTDSFGGIHYYSNKVLQIHYYSNKVFFFLFLFLYLGVDEAWYISLNRSQWHVSYA